jgi:unsaturated chondroitin disaccharide hydrolase
MMNGIANYFKLLGAGIITSSLLMGCSESVTVKDSMVDQNLAYCNTQIQKTLRELDDADDSNIDYSMIPRNVSTRGTHWERRKASAEEWCSGFWPGILWYDYENTGSEEIAKQADLFTRALKPIVETPVYDHDLGFLIFCSYGNGYRLTQKPEYKQVILNAADSLATLYNPKAGTICSWPRNEEMLGGHNTIMDNMINLEMLFWAAKNGGSHALYDIAVSHADKTMQNQFRPDYSCYHVAVYDKATGAFLRGCNHQGFNDESMWARGQAWAIYGFTVVYRETKNPKYLEFVQKVADHYLERLPSSKIPYWDFDDPDIPNAPLDAAAAAVTASALVELSQYVEDDETSQRYLNEAKAMIQELSSERYQSRQKNNSFLMHSTGNFPAHSEIDYSIVYADYYYIEALTRLKKLEKPEK